MNTFLRVHVKPPCGDLGGNAHIERILFLSFCSGHSKIAANLATLVTPITPFPWSHISADNRIQYLHPILLFIYISFRGSGKVKGGAQLHM